MGRGGIFRSPCIRITNHDDFPHLLMPHFPLRNPKCFHAVVLEKLAAVAYLNLVVTVNGEPKYFTLENRMQAV